MTEPLNFQGINKRIDLSDLTKDDFESIAASATATAEIDIAETFDLEAGEYTVSAEGVLPFSNHERTGVSGVIPYKSNSISITVTKPTSASSILNRRATLMESSCSPEHKAIVQAALKRAASAASAAAKAARIGDARLFEYLFRTSDKSVRQQVAARFDAIAREAAAGTNGTVNYDCGDHLGACGKGVLAYAMQAGNMVVNCPSYYKIMAASPNCGGKDQGLVAIHEMSHLKAVFTPAAGDYAYGYNACIALDKEKAIMNADTHLYYAGGE